MLTKQKLLAVESMKGKLTADFIFKRSGQAVTLDTYTAVKFDDTRVKINPQLLFQRLTVAVQSSDNIEETFRYELCSYPLVLFDLSVFLREPQKPVLANAIWEKLTESLLEYLEILSMC